MKFAITTPILDGRDFFRACAASVAAQRSADVEVEHFIRESDRSAESCADIAAQYGCRYFQGADSGLYDAIQSGLDEAAASGADILAWLNSDEQYLPGALAKAAAAFDANPGADFIFGDYLMIAPDTLELLSARREIQALPFFLRHGVDYIISCATFFRREAWLKHRPFDLSYKLVADKKFTYKAFISGARFRHVSEFFGCYGSTGKNASLAPWAPQDQARLRAEIGAYKSLNARNAVRAVRLLVKLLAGCHSKKKISTTLFDSGGRPRAVSATCSGRWVDK
jgi:Glycosyltransferases involved in cell wall biogenesis